MEENAKLTENKSDDFSAETISAAMIFERLSPELRIEILEILRNIHSK